MNPVKESFKFAKLFQKSHWIRPKGAFIFFILKNFSRINPCNLVLLEENSLQSISRHEGRDANYLLSLKQMKTGYSPKREAEGFEMKIRGNQ